MKITPVASPHQVAPTQVNHQAQAAAKANAIAKLTGQGNQQQPQQIVGNQSSVGVEELGAIMPKIDTSTSSEQMELGAITEDTKVVEPQTPPKPSEDPTLSRQFAQLARQEKALRAKVQAQERDLKAREASIAAKEAEIAQKAKQDMSDYIHKDRIKRETLTVLAEAGASYDDLTNQFLQAQQPTDPRVQATINQLQSKIQALEKASEESRKSAVDNQTAAYDAAVRQIRTDVVGLVKNDPAFEAIRATKSVNDVVELITETYKKDNVLLTIEEAAQQVEDYLVEEASKLARLTKIQKRLNTSPERGSAAPAQQKQPQPKQQPQMKTLTNATSSSRQLTAKERAILAFKGELDKR
jgi:hypothetical protein